MLNTYNYLFFIKDLVSLLTLAAIAYGLGARLCRVIGYKAPHAAHAFIFSSALGLILMSIIYLVQGLCHGLYPIVSYLLTLVLLGIAFGPLNDALKKMPDYLRFMKSNWRGEWILFACLGLAWMLNNLMAVLPPNQADVLLYHLGAPKAWLLSHQIIYIPHNYLSNFPMNLEMHYLNALVLGSDALAVMVHNYFTLLCALAVYAFVRRRHGSLAGSCGAVLFYAIPRVLQVAGWAYVDLGLAFYITVGICGLIEYLSDDEHSPGLLEVSALCLGGAIGVKYTGLLFGLAFGIILLLLARSITRSVTVRKLIEETAVLTGFGILPAIPWFLKNLVMTGNPVYPLAYNLFGGHDWSNELAVNFIAGHTSGAEGFSSIWPKLMEMQGGENPIGMFAIIISLIFLILPHIRYGTRLLSGFGIAYLLGFTVLTHQNLTFLLPVYPIWSIILTLALVRAFKWQTWLPNLFVIFLALIVLMNMGIEMNGGVYNDSFSILSGRKTKADMVGQPRDKMDMFTAMKNMKDKGTRVVFENVGDGYYCTKPYIANTLYDESVLRAALGKAEKVNDIINYLSDCEATHILFRGEPMISKDRKYLFFQTAYLIPEFKTGNYSLYEIGYSRVGQINSENTDIPFNPDGTPEYYPH
jgi:glycosyl transferase family 22 (putative mannosyltransferase)